MASADDYLEQLKKLQPSGIALPKDNQSTWVKLLDAIAQTFARIDASANRLLNESFPDTTTELLPNWERIAGLPDECGDIADTFAIRRANLLTRLTLTGGQSSAYFIDLAAIYGFTITISEPRPFRVGESGMGDVVTDDDEWVFVWVVNAPLNTIMYLRSGIGASGEPIATWNNTRLGCFIDKYKPAHTVVLYS